MRYIKSKTGLLIAFGLMAYILGGEYLNSVEPSPTDSASSKCAGSGPDHGLRSHQRQVRLQGPQTWLSVEDLPPLSPITERTVYGSTHEVEIAINHTG